MLIKNIDTIPNTYYGQLVEVGEYYLIQPHELNIFLHDNKLKVDITLGRAVLIDSDVIPVTVEEFKAIKNKEIDKRTVELISNGFTFDSANFSLSEPAQTNWLGIKSMEDLLTFPINITTSDDGQYSLVQAQLNAFVGTAVATKQAHLDSGRSLKLQVNSCITEAEVEAIVDDRV